MGRRGRTYLVDEGFFFVTTTVVRFLNVFSDPKVCDLLIDNIKYYQTKYNFTILSYVIMPSHFHLIVEVQPKLGTISEIMRDIKKHSAWDIMEYLKLNNLYREIFETEAEPYSDQERKFWMKRFDDEVIRDQKMLWTKIKYIHNNPVKAGIVERPEDYRYSSARNYINDDHSVLTVDTEIAGIEL
jgi:putative transposase